MLRRRNTRNSSNDNSSSKDTASPKSKPKTIKVMEDSSLTSPNSKTSTATTIIGKEITSPPTEISSPTTERGDTVGDDDDIDEVTSTLTEAYDRLKDIKSKNSLAGDDSVNNDDCTGFAGKPALSNEAVAKDEKKKRKIMDRVLSALLMMLSFLVILYMGHVYICGLIFVIEVLLFRELVTVRYNTFFHIIEETIPLFRTTQWLWFVTAIFYTYSEFIVEMIKSNTSLHHLLSYAQLQSGISFLLYAGTFVITIATMQRDHLRFQLNQLCWTILVLALTVGQLKYIMHNVYNGLFWFFFPVMLVISNDTFAYACGMTCGKKFISKTFFKISPNKSWEGFIGGAICTIITAWFLSRFLAKFQWMVCPTNNFSFYPRKLQCDPHPVFQSATTILPIQVFELLPSLIAHMIPGIVDICSVGGDIESFTACISGEESHTHHHFELVVRDLYPIQIHALGLGLFASLVAPFGGFLASAIKRAYGIKDFDSIIPGHGGLMDRMDCQFMMALCTWVFYNTFVNMATVSVPKMLYMYNLLKDSEREDFLKQILEINNLTQEV